MAVSWQWQILQCFPWKTLILKRQLVMALLLPEFFKSWWNTVSLLIIIIVNNLKNNHEIILERYVVSVPICLCMLCSWRLIKGKWTETGCIFKKNYNPVNVHLIGFLALFVNFLNSRPFNFDSRFWFLDTKSIYIHESWLNEVYWPCSLHLLGWS